MHDFDHCLYSLLNDDPLMDPEYLLINFNFDNNFSHVRRKEIINDIDTI